MSNHPTTGGISGERKTSTEIGKNPLQSRSTLVDEFMGVSTVAILVVGAVCFTPLNEANCSR